ncbi:MAG: UDP-N-acetylmuramate dehydrogenase [Patescibacteria group bacterium]
MLQRNVRLDQYAHWKIGGPADYFCEPKNVEELISALREGRTLGIPIFILGGGTNLLISDQGFRGLVIRPLFEGIRCDGTQIIAEAGVSMEKLLTFAAASGLSGLEWAGGLPGTLGGAIRGNAGAFGGEIKDSVHKVVSIDIEDHDFKMVKRENTECRFGYRTSIFKEKGNEVVIEATLVLKAGESDAIRLAGESRIAYRKERHPIEFPNAGSVFKNVPVTSIPTALKESLAKVIKQDPFPVVPAAYLISEAGMKGSIAGGAKVSEKHPNFIVNTGGATAADIETLIGMVKGKVKEKFGIMLEEEIMRVGESR